MNKASGSPLFYDVLNVSKDATPDEIKKAYKRLAVKWHPDKNLSNQQEASEMFKLVSEAYEVLSDPARRLEYDQQLFGDPERTSRREGRTARNYNQDFNPDYSFRRAQDIFDNFFAEFDDDPFFSQFSGIRSNRHHSDSNNRHNVNSGFGGSRMGMGMDVFSSDPFFSGMNMSFGGMSSSMSSTMSTSMSSSSSGVRCGGTSRSESTTTVIGPDGRKRTKKEITIVNADGSRQTTVEEMIDGVSTYARAIDDGNYQSDTYGRRTIGGHNNNGSGRNIWISKK